MRAKVDTLRKGKGAAMIDRQLVFEDFADKVGDIFAIGEDGIPAIALTLMEAEPLPIDCP
jgi:hypothetical protein